MSRKICPLFYAIDMIRKGDCITKECAWWDEVDKRCVIHAFKLFEEWLKFLNAFLIKEGANEQNQS